MAHDPEQNRDAEDIRPRIMVRPNGPYRVYGPILVVDVDGNEFELPDEVFVLCRCGHSANKPFCDGTHKSMDFTPETRAQPGLPELGSSQP